MFDFRSGSRVLGALLLRRASTEPRHQDVTAAAEAKRVASSRTDQDPAGKTAKTLKRVPAQVDSRHWHTVSIDKASPWLDDHPGIVQGYRPPLTGRQAVLSMFRWHNETINIWTHVAGILWCVYLAWWTHTRVLAPQHADWHNYLALGAFLVSGVVMFACSVVYHTGCCCSARANADLLRVDLAGIGVVIAGGYFPGVYYAYWCHGMLQSIYSGFALAILMLGSLPSAVPNFYQNGVPNSEKQRTKLVATFLVVIALCFVPHIHMAHEFGIDVHAEHWQYVALMTLFGALGIFFFASMFPESVAAGRFDFVGSSHQLWHICVILAFTARYMACVSMYSWWNTHTCPESVPALAPSV